MLAMRARTHTVRRMNLTLSCSSPSGETITMVGKFVRHLKPLRTGGYRELIRLDVQRGGKWRRFIDGCSSVTEAVQHARKNGWVCTPAAN